MPRAKRPMPEKVSVQCRVNGHDATLRDFPMARLLDALRDQLNLTGIKEGCGEGECGACSIEMDGRLVNSCLVPVLQAEGAAIRTIEGVANGEQLHAVQQAFIAHGGAQCGICTPGNDSRGGESARAQCASDGRRSARRARREIFAAAPAIRKFLNPCCARSRCQRRAIEIARSHPSNCARRRISRRRWKSWRASRENGGRSLAARI